MEPTFIWLSAAFLLFSSAWADEIRGPLSLETVLERALRSHPSVIGSEARARSEHSAIRAQYAPPKPMLGLMYEREMTGLQIAEGPMRSWTISQELEFPIKYGLKGSAQRSRAKAADQEAALTRLELRAQVISSYYRLHSLLRIHDLLQANLESARRTARTAESRHSTGQVPQQDEMKAHVEETRINNEILINREELDAAEADLQQLLQTSDGETKLVLPAKHLPVPHLMESGRESGGSRAPDLPDFKESRAVRVAEARLEEAESRRALAYWDYVPDFRFNFQKPLSNMPSSAFSFGVELSVPLWFFLGQSAEAASASTQATQMEKNLAQTRLETGARVKTLFSRARHHETLIQVFETSLIPQATSTFNSSEAAYRAGRISLLELLDSQRALYQTRIGFYRTLTELVDALTELEKVSAQSYSSLPFPEDLLL